MIAKILFILLAILAIPWAIGTWWKMRRARGPRERSLIGRSSLGAGMFIIAAVIAFAFLAGRAQLVAAPLVVVAGIVMRHGLRRARERARVEDADPLASAKRVGPRV